MSLLQLPILRHLYKKANSDSNVDAAVAFWINYLASRFRAESHYCVVPSQCLESQVWGPIDIVVTKVDPAIGADAAVLLVRCKRESEPWWEWARDVQRAEEELLRAACKYLASHQAIASVYGMTVWGGSARVWVFRHHRPQLEPVYGDEGTAVRQWYIDASSAYAMHIDSAMSQIRGEIRSVNAVQQVSQASFQTPICGSV